MTLPVSVYTANRGYSWSNATEAIPASRLDRLYRYISAVRGDFPDPLSVEVGVVSDGKIVAAFTIQNVARWDSEQRSSDYAAFAFFTLEQAKDVDFVELLNNDFFWTPTRKPPTTLVYSGVPSEPAPSLDVRSLAADGVCLLRNPRTAGSFFARYGARSSHWVGLLKAENILRIQCSGWK